MGIGSRWRELWANRAFEICAVLGCLVLVALITVAAWFSFREHSSAERTFRLRQASNLALTLEVHARDTMISVDETTRRIKRGVEAEGSALNMQRLLGESRDIADYIAVASVADAQGRLVMSTLPLPAGISVADLPHFRAHVERDTGEPFFGQPVKGRVSGKWSFHVSRRINKADGSFGGVAIVAVDFSYWQEVLKEGWFGDGTVIALLGRDGVPRALHGDSSSVDGMAGMDWSFLLNEISRGNSGTVIGGNGRHSTWLYRVMPGYPMIVAVGLSQHELEQRLDSIRSSLVAGVISFAFLAVLLTVALLRAQARQRAYATERSRISGVLRQSEERFRLAFDQAAIGMGLRPVGHRDRKWQKVNQKFCDFLGYSEAELLQLSPEQITDPSEEFAAAQIEARLLDGEINTDSREKQYLRKDGGRVWAQVTVTVLHYPDGQPAQILCIIQDIDDRKRAEAALQQSEERLRTVAAHIEEGLALFGPDDRLIFFNESYRRMQEPGVSRLEPGMRFEDLARLRAMELRRIGEIEDVEAFIAGRIASHRNPQGVAIERRRADGGCHLIREVRTADGYTAVSFVDVSELKRRESALRESESRFRAIFEHAGLGITLRDVRDRTSPWLAVNDKFCEMTGYSRAELMGMNIAQLSDQEDNAGADPSNEQLRSGELRNYSREKRIRRKDGDFIWTDLTVAALPDEQGRPSQVIAIYQDISARKAAEDRARRGEVQFKAVFDHAGVGISVRPAHDRRLPYLAVNDRFCELTGYSRDELLRLSTFELTRAEDQAVAAKDNDSLLGGEVTTYGREKALVCKDGSLRWVALSVAILPDDAGQPQRIMSTYQDIHARKVAEARLRESEGRLRAVIAAEPECVATVSPEGDLLEMNPAGLRMLEAGSLEELQRLPFLQLVLPEYRRSFVRLQLRIRAGNTGMLEFETRGMRGKRRWLQIHAAPLHDDTGRVSALLGIARDITEMRQAQQAVAAERNLLRTVIDNLPDRIRVKDRDMRYILANATWLEARARGRDIRGLRNTDFLPPEMVSTYDAEDREVLNTGKPSTPREVIEGSPDAPRFFVTTKTPLRDSDGRIDGLVAISRDVTDFKRRSIEVEKLNAALEARVAERTAQLTNANEELEAFASSVSHDLRAPLRSIDGLAAVLLEDSGDRLNEEGRGYISRIRGAAARMAGLIEDLLRLSRVSRAELRIESVDLSALAAGIVADLRREHPQREVGVTIASGLIVQGDAGLLHAALSNLLHNAWKFTGRSGHARIEFGCTINDSQLNYFVRDNGAGFDMAQVNRLFGAFQRLHTDHDFPGTGIGLATVRRIIRRHGGDIWATSAPDAGATFQFTLGSRPASYGLRSPQLVPLMAAEPVPAQEVASPGKTSVLLVDDDPDLLILTARALRPDGYAVLTAGNGDEALKLLGQYRVDVVVSDFSMPGMNGAQFLSRVNKLYPQSLRLIVSGQTMNRAMQSGLRKGEIHFYFEKQRSFDLVRECIRNWLATRPAKH